MSDHCPHCLMPKYRPGAVETPRPITDAMLEAALVAFNGGDNPYQLTLADYGATYREAMRAALLAAEKARTAVTGGPA